MGLVLVVSSEVKVVNDRNDYEKYFNIAHVLQQYFGDFSIFRDYAKNNLINYLNESYNKKDSEFLPVWLENVIKEIDLKITSAT